MLPRRVLLTAAIVGSLIASAAVAGCGSGSNSSKGSATVTMWAYPLAAQAGADAKYWNGVVKDFKSGHPGIDVKVEVEPWENRDTKLTTAIAGHTGPDVLYVNDFQIPNLANHHWIKPLDTYLRDVANAFYPASRKALSFDGSLYAAPALQTVGGTAYNKRAFAKAGIKSYPTTWSELERDAPALKRAGYYAMQYDALQSLNLSFYDVLWQFGGDVLDASGKHVTFNGQAGLSALSFLRRMVDKGYIAREGLTEPTPDIVDKSMAAGKVAVNPFMYSSEMGLLAKDIGKENLTVGPPLGGVKRTMFSSNAGFALLSGSQHPDAAVQWIKFITSEPQMRALNKFSGYFAPRPALADLHAHDPLISPFGKYVQYSRGGVQSLYASQIESVLTPQLQGALVGKSTPKQALDAAAKAAQQQLDSAG